MDGNESGRTGKTRKAGTKALWGAKREGGGGEGRTPNKEISVHGVKNWQRTWKHKKTSWETQPQKGPVKAQKNPEKKTLGGENLWDPSSRLTGQIRWERW